MCCVYKTVILREYLHKNKHNTMKAKDLIYIAIIGGLGYLLFFNKKKPSIIKTNEDVKTNGIADAPDNNASLPDLFGKEGAEIEPIEPTVQETTFVDKKEVESFTIPYANYNCTYSKKEGRFYCYKKGVLIKASKEEITEADYLRALNFYEKKGFPCQSIDNNFN